MIFVRYLLLLGVSSLFVYQTFSQSLPVRWMVDEQPSIDLPDSLIPATLADSCLVYLRRLHQAAYLEASIDSIWQADHQIWIKLHLGPTYRWSYLDFSAIPVFILNDLTLSVHADRLFSYEQIQDLFQEILQKAENKGYPFAAVRLDSIALDTEQIRARVLVMLNDRIQIERIDMDGDLKISDRYLSHLLDVEVGDIFNRQQIIDIRNRLLAVSFIKYQRDPMVDFLGNGATLHLYLDKKNANRFDILLGLLPSNNENRRFQLTGNVNVDLANQFGAGEIFRFNYESLMPGTQNLKLSLNYPFVFNWPFGTDLNFNLYKRDTTYIDVGYQAGIQYLMRRNNYFEFFIENLSTNILTVDTNRVKQTLKLPVFLDISQKLFGAAIHFEKLDYRFNPRRGYEVTARTALGNKKIKKNTTILGLHDANNPEFDFNELYKDLDLNSLQYKLSTQLQTYLPLFKSSTLKFAWNAALIGSGQGLYDNELYRIGGTKLLRGFNEQSVLASLYSVFTTEYRLLFNQNSNLFVFWDLAYVEKRTAQSRQTDQPMGVGTGLNLETKVGIFSISYALGSQQNQGLSFREGRIHFGMISQF